MRRETVDILGVAVDAIKKQQLLNQLAERIESNTKTFIVTPYSEFFYYAAKQKRFKDVLNSADFSVADGIGTIWAAHFLSKSLKAKSFYGKAFEALAKAKLSLLTLLFYKKKFFDILPEKISGSELFWDLIQLAEQKKQRIFLLGGAKGVANKTAEIVKKKYTDVIISGTSSANASDEGLLEEINSAKTDILMVCFGPVKQELWIKNSLEDLNIKLAIGLGGTFDYISGTKASPPSIIRSIGLEWLFRLLTQSGRIKRIWHATFSFVQMCIREKVFSSMPFRPNVVGVILNTSNQVFVARRVNNDPESGETEHGEDHWQFPQGGTEGDDSKGAVLREVWEETGMKQLEILGKAKKTHTYEWNNAVRNILFNPLKYVGQIQEIYFLKYTGDGSDIQLDRKELDIYKWVEVKDLEKTIHKYRRSILNIVLEEIHKYV